MVSSWFLVLTCAVGLVSIWLPSETLAQSDSASASASATQSASTPVSTACGDIFDNVNLDPNNNWLYFASDVYDCLMSVPFLDAVALRYVDYFNFTIQFQSTLAYLKTPPAGYQQPAIDVQHALNEIRQNITAGYYRTQYDFEVTLQKLILRMHDGHVTLDAGALSAFTFGSPYSIMSVSVDGVQPPKVYIADDIIAFTTQGGPRPSAIEAINGVETTEYLTQFAQNFSYGLLEPDADWNNLMYSPVQDILSTLDLFAWNALYYPGDEIVFTFANNTNLSQYYLAYYNKFEDTGPLTTGGDFYNYFVLGNIPASYKPLPASGTDTSNTTNTTDTATANSTSWYDVSPAYPQIADVVQPDLSLSGSGVLSGYFLRDIATGVFSVPVFDGYGEPYAFSNTTANFIASAKAAGMTKIVIDLQGNQGGYPLLAFDTFQQFFPNIDPFAGSRRRDFGQENILGNSMTDFWDSLTPEDPTYEYDYYYSGLAANEWVITDRLNAVTGRNFSSWPEFYNPIVAQGDLFSQTERYNLSSPLFDRAASGFVPPPRPNSTPPFSAQNIILLTDAACGSTCALFVEMMTHEAGVRTVVVGGRPSAGPMQAASGSRGACSYDAETLDSNLKFARAVNETANTTLPQVRDQSIYTYYLGFNLRDQLRQNDPVPLQFKYQAADCRIYYTFANAYNMERLWRDATAAIYTNTTLCVAGSTGFSESANSTSPKPPPSAHPVEVPFHGFFSSDNTTHTFPYGLGLRDSVVQRTGAFVECTGSCTCYQRTSFPCPNGKIATVCGTPCTAGQSCGNGYGTCQGFVEQTEQKASPRNPARGATNTLPPKKRNHGTCQPNLDTAGSMPVCNSGHGPSYPPM